MHPVVRQAISGVSKTGHHWIPAVCLCCFSRDEHVDQFPSLDFKLITVSGTRNRMCRSPIFAHIWTEILARDVAAFHAYLCRISESSRQIHAMHLSWTLSDSQHQLPDVWASCSGVTVKVTLQRTTATVCCQHRKYSRTANKSLSAEEGMWWQV